MPLRSLSASRSSISGKNLPGILVAATVGCAIIGAVGWAVICIGLLFLPGAYVKARKRLHAARLLRCDWLGAVR